MAVRILLITPQFYGIEKKIKAVLEEQNCEVTWFENKTLLFDYHGTNSKFQLLRRIYFLLFSPHIKYLRKEFDKINNPEFDILFSINANIICPYLLRKLKSKNPQLYSVLFLWDSFSMYNWTKELKLFDKVLTFDPSDSLNFQIEYKPNFYIRSITSPSLNNEYDLFFVGKFSSARLALVDKIVNQTKIHGFNHYIKLWPAYRIMFHNHFFYSFFRRLKFENNWVISYQQNFEAVEGLLKKDYLVTESLNYDEMQCMMLSSNVILDLPYKMQTGYTHRLIDALANGRKVLTTNSNIRKESFYNSEQIHILDEQNPDIDFEWIKQKSVFQVHSYFSGLELSAWLKSILNVRHV
jgi:hypothetical protein